MQKTTIPHDALVLVGDGTRAVFFRNRGSLQQPRMAVEGVMAQPSPATHEQGADRPGRVHARLGTRRSAVEDTDWHRLAEDRFAVEIAEALYRLAHAKQIDRLIVVAPPKLLGTLRKALHKEVRDHLSAEVPIELATQSVKDIKSQLEAWW